MEDEEFGHSLLEVFQIVYIGAAEIKPEDQTGTIKIRCSDGADQYLYNVKSVDPCAPSIQCGGQLMVTVKSPTIRCEQHDIEFDLFRGAYKGTIDIDWDTLSSKPTKWHGKIQSRDGTSSIIVHYGLYTDARLADIQVKLLDNSIQEVYGVVAASNSALQRDLRHCTSVLFAMEPEYPLRVCWDRDPCLPLSKSCVAVPFNATLYVHLHLTCGGVVYKERLSFKHQKAGQVVLVETSSRTIEVKVTWADEF